MHFLKARVTLADTPFLTLMFQIKGTIQFQAVTGVLLDDIDLMYGSFSDTFSSTNL